MKKILFIGVIFLLLIVGLLIAIPFIVKDDVVNYIKNESVNAKIDFNHDIDISLLSSFPQLKIKIKDLSIINNPPFEGDTLLAVEAIQIKVDVMSIFGDAIKLNSLDLISPRINVLVTSKELANYDIALPSEEVPEEEEEATEESSFKLEIEHFGIQNAHINYFDTSLATYLTINNLNYTLNGKFNPEQMDVNMLTTIEKLDVWFDGIHYLNQVNLGFNAEMMLNLAEEFYEFKENELSINKVKMAFDGNVKLEEDDMLLNLKYGLLKTEFKDLLSLVPVIFMEGYEELQADGKFLLDGTVNGRYTEDSYPAFTVNMGIENGTFKYPDLPSALRNTQMDMNIDNPGGDLDATTVNMKKLHLEINDDPLDATLLLKNPMSDPYVQTALKGIVNFGNVSQLVKLEGVNKLEGILTADFSAKGRMSDLDNERYDAFSANGNMSLKQFQYEADDIAEPIAISTCVFGFSPEAANLSEFDMTMGKSDIQMNGKIDNYFGWFLRSDTIVGSLNINSSYLNVNPWLEDEESETETTSSEVEEESYELEAFEIPKNIFFVLNSNINQLIYDTYEMEKFTGRLHLRNGKLSMQDVGFNMLEGSMLVSGYYDSKNPKAPETDFNFSMKNISIPGLYETFNTVKELMPIADRLEGLVDGKIRLSTTHGQDLMPDLKTVNGKASLTINKAKLSGDKTWEKIVNLLKWDESRHRLLLDKVNTSFKIENGNLILDPTEFKVQNINCSLEGSSSLDQTVDYTMLADLPAGDLKKQGNQILTGIFGRDVNLPGGDFIKMALDITGAADDPKITPRIVGGDGGQSLKDAAKGMAKEKLNEAKETAISKGKEQLAKEAQKLKEEAAALRAKAVQLKEEAAKLSKEGEKLKAEGDNLRKEGEKAKKELEATMNKNLPKVAKDKLMIPVNAIFKKADDKVAEANNYFDLAKKPEMEADRLIKRADELEKQADAKLQ